ncbi:MAG: dUTP diphosphatase [Oscillospiraceae bacterium]|nr:dUTP diphosphatase [Oscillospiraceae bacterium]
MTLKIKKLRQKAAVPATATPGSAGYDLSACIDSPVEIPAGETRTIPTGIAIALPSRDWGAFVFARSGLGIKKGIVPGNCVGVIDSDYRGEILVGLHNHSAESYTVLPGDRIAQMILLPVGHFEVEECEDLEDTARGSGGFGSTSR